MDRSRPTLPPDRFVDLPGRGRTFVRERAGPDAAPAVVLLHGWTATALNWCWSYTSPADHFRVISLDHRGHGLGRRTDAPFRLSRGHRPGGEQHHDGTGRRRRLIAGGGSAGVRACNCSERLSGWRRQTLRRTIQWSARRAALAPWTSMPAKAAVHAMSATASVIFGTHSRASRFTTVRILNVATPYMPRGKTNAQ